MKHNTLNFSILILVALVASWFINVKAKEAISDFEKLGAVKNIFDKKLEENVVMVSPRKGDVISTPVKIQGSISGRWFFEGTLIGRIVDSDGNVLGQGPLIARGDWMTEENVNFEGIIPFSTSKSKEGHIVIGTDDSGGVGNISSYKTPILFMGDETSFCTGEGCGAVMCSTGSIGSNGVCVHDSGVKNL